MGLYGGGGYWRVGVFVVGPLPTGSALLRGEEEHWMVQVCTHVALFRKGAKPTQLTLTFKGASTWEGYGVLGVLMAPLLTPQTSMLL